MSGYNTIVLAFADSEIDEPQDDDESEEEREKDFQRLRDMNARLQERG